MNGSLSGAGLFDESVIGQVAAHENWNDKEREGWESSKTSLRIELGVTELRLWGSVAAPNAIAFVSTLFGWDSKVASRGASTPILDAIARLNHALRRRAWERVQTAKQSALEETGYTMTVDRESESDVWVSSARRLREEDDSGDDEPEPIPLAQSLSELVAAENGLEALRGLLDSPESDAENR